jgi:hypothetical protein
MSGSALARLPPAKSANPLPVAYRTAVAAIAACRSFDEANDWSNKADALAAWAKIFANDEVQKEAKALKLHAFRRMGALASELSSDPNQASSAYAVLLAHGYKKSQASAAVKISKMPPDDFVAVTESKKPPSPSVLCTINLRNNAQWARFSLPMRSFVGEMRKVDPKSLSATLSERELQSAYGVCREMLYWLVPFHDELKRLQAMSETQ